MTNDQQSLEGVNFNYAFRNWESLSRREQLISMISDDYKSLNGIRPRFSVDHMTVKDLEKWHLEILQDLDREIDSERREELEHSQAVNQATTHQPWTLGELCPSL